MSDVMIAAPGLKRRVEASFLGYFPTWQRFSHDLAAVRDPRDPAQSHEESLVVVALDKLADLMGRTHEDIGGQYAVVQSGARGWEVARDDLMSCYNAVFEDFHGTPAF